MRQQIPAAIRSMLKIGELGWIDRNSWNADTGTCTWTIEPSFLSEYIACSGETTFTAAMAGRGTRVTFAGELDLKPGLLGSLGSMEPMVSGFLESIVTTIIPRNLRAVVEAAAAFELRDREVRRSTATKHAVVKAEPRIGERRQPREIVLQLRHRNADAHLARPDSHRS